jgi:hypothetical protein
MVWMKLSVRQGLTVCGWASKRQIELFWEPLGVIKYLMRRLILAIALFLSGVASQAAQGVEGYKPCFEKTEFERPARELVLRDRRGWEKPLMERPVADRSFQYRNEIVQPQFEKSTIEKPLYDSPCTINRPARERTADSLKPSRSTTSSRVDFSKNGSPSIALKKVKVGTLVPSSCPCEEPLSSRPAIANRAVVLAR